MPQKIGQHIVALFIPRSGGWTRSATDHYLERRRRRIRRKIFVGIHLHIRRMIHRQ